MHLDARFVIHNNQLGLVEVEYFAKFLRDLQLVYPLFSEERLLISDPDQLLWVGFYIAPFSHRETERCRA